MKSRVQRARAHLRQVFTDCCEIHLDRRGGVIDYQPRGSGSCECRSGGFSACTPSVPDSR